MAREKLALDLCVEQMYTLMHIYENYQPKQSFDEIQFDVVEYLFHKLFSYLNIPDYMPFLWAYMVGPSYKRLLYTILQSYLSKK